MRVLAKYDLEDCAEFRRTRQTYALSILSIDARLWPGFQKLPTNQLNLPRRTRVWQRDSFAKFSKRQVARLLLKFQLRELKIIFNSKTNVLDWITELVQTPGLLNKK